LDQAPILVQEVEEVEDVELHAHLVPAELRDRLPDREVQPVLERAAAAVPLHDLAALLVQAGLLVDELLERLRGGHVLLEIGADARPDPDLVQVRGIPGDRKSTRLNSSHVKISYAVFCLT